jgi:predicted nuclease of predicted toxin-antitoxin system
MRIYLDEDIASALLATLLQKAGHDVITAGDAGTLGYSDAAQLTFAIKEKRHCLTRNYDDFEELHLLIHHARGNHHGILVIRRENDPTRDLSSKGIVAALRRLESSGMPIHNEYIVLNQWR